MEIRKIVITGGPCAGKTTALSWIQNAFTKAGWTVLFVPETATELISGGVAPWTCGTNKEYQRLQLRLQKTKEEIYEAAAETMPKEHILIVCDRGMCDNHAYMTDEEFKDLLAELGMSEVEARDQYDAVFHLVTAANGAERYYTLDNNVARTESVEEAIAVDDRILSCWIGHPTLRVIDNSTGFDGKLKRLIHEISVLFGSPFPMEIEREFLIEFPDLDWLENKMHARRVEIVQNYLLSTNDEEIRIRRRGEEGSFVYFLTSKRQVSDLLRITREERLTEDQYYDLLREADPKKHAIQKTRYYFTYDNQYFEIDIYPFWKDKAILLIELDKENEEIRFMDEVKVIREVTGDPQYKNSYLASHYPE